MNLLIISPRQTNDGKSAPQGGIGTWTEIFLRSYDKVKHYIDFVDISPIGRRKIQVNSKRSALDEIIRTTHIFTTLNMKLKRQQFDVAHINSACGSFGIIRDYLCARKINRSKVKVVSHFHCDVEFQLAHNQLAKKYFHKLIKVSDEIIVLNENSQKYILDQCGRSSIKVANFVETSILIKDKHILRGAISKILFVGYVQREKGCLEIYGLAKRCPEIVFELAGLVHSDVVAWPKPENVLLLGAVQKEEVFKRMDDADIFIFPSYSEGFSIALVEAMARGLPAIVTPVGANIDMIEDQGGILVNVGDIDGMENAIFKMQNPEIRFKMSKWNIEKVKNNYTADQVIKHLFSIYEGIKR